MEKAQKIEHWSINDPRLPKNEDIIAEIPSDEFIQSVYERQNEPIAMGYDSEKDEWNLIDGRRRILALRTVANANGEDVAIDVIVKQADYYTCLEMSMQFNHFRSDNVLHDYATIRELLGREGADYKMVGKRIGMSPNAVRNLDLRFGNVPGWALESAVANKLSVTVAARLGDLKRQGKAETVKALKKVFDKEGKLTLAQVNQSVRVQKAEIAGNFSEQLIAKGRQDFFSWDEVHAAWAANTIPQLLGMEEGNG